MKENISINKTKLYRLVKHYFESEIPNMSKTEYRRANNSYGWLYFYTEDDTYYKAFFSRMGKDYMLGIYEINPIKVEVGEKLDEKVYHPSVEILKNIGIYKEVQLKV